MQSDNAKILSAAEKQYTKMTQTPIKKLFASLAVPTVISMLITTVYNATDTYFVSKINISASGATGVVFSLMAILQAFGFMFGHGSGSCISRNLGAQNIEKARRYSSTGLFLALLTGALIGILGIIFLAPFMRLLGSTATILPYSKAYGIFILAAGPAMTGSCVANNILRYEGKASLAMVGLTAGGVLNIILDPILIFGAKMGIAGAGLSTAISQYISFAILMIMYYKGDAQSKPNIKYITLKPRFVATIITTGLPSLARQGLNSVSNMVLNIEAALYGDACIAAMSIVAKCANLIFSVCVGIGQGFQPVSAFNYGAKKYSRVKSRSQIHLGPFHGSACRSCGRMLCLCAADNHCFSPRKRSGGNRRQNIETALHCAAVFANGYGGEHDLPKHRPKRKSIFPCLLAKRAFLYSACNNFAENLRHNRA